MKVLITDPIAKEGVKILKESGLEVEEKSGISPEELERIIPGYDALIVRSATKVRENVINSAERLKVIGRAGVGLDNIDLPAAERKGIKVVNTPSATSISVAELAMAHIFACARPVVEGTLTLRDKKWEKKRLKGTELYGKTLGIIGLGRIGRELARMARGIGMEVLGYRRRMDLEVEGVRLTHLDGLLENSDVISVHLPLTDQTRHFIGDAEFQKMKDGVIFINCSRGGVVDENALYNALVSGKVSRAASDVFEKEPPEDSPLLGLDNFLCTPHIGAQTREGQKRAGIQIAELVRDTLLS